MFKWMTGRTTAGGSCDRSSWLAIVTDEYALLSACIAQRMCDWPGRASIIPVDCAQMKRTFVPPRVATGAPDAPINTEVKTAARRTAASGKPVQPAPENADACYYRVLYTKRVPQKVHVDPSTCKLPCSSCAGSVTTSCRSSNPRHPVQCLSRTEAEEQKLQRWHPGSDSRRHLHPL